jgi:catechol 2,3-dioxygenase-like lactoylglutathione lyase family enzyme
MKIRIHRIDHVQLCVPPDKVDEARKFYTGVLGFVETRAPPSFASFGFRGFWCRSGSVEVHIAPDPEIGRTKQHPAFEIDDVAGVRKYLEGLGIKTFDEPLIEGRTRFTFHDPFNNRIELLQMNI